MDREALVPFDEDDPTSWNTVDFRGEPSYKILVHTDDRNLIKGSPFNVIIFVSGAGDVKHSKITVSIPPVLIDGKVVLKYLLDRLENPDPPPREMPSFFNIEAPVLYTNWNPQDPLKPNLTNLGEREWSENPEDKVKEPILQFSFKVSQKAPVGTHKIYLKSTYKGKYSKIWYSNERIIDVHVRNWYEKQGFQIVALVVLVLTAIAAFISIYTQFITNYLINPIMFAFFWIFIIVIIIFMAYLNYDER
jgi:hypothetical protein